MPQKIVSSERLNLFLSGCTLTCTLLTTLLAVISNSCQTSNNITVIWTWTIGRWCCRWWSNRWCNRWTIRITTTYRWCCRWSIRITTWRRRCCGDRCSWVWGGGRWPVRRLTWGSNNALKLWSKSTWKIIKGKIERIYLKGCILSYPIYIGPVRLFSENIMIHVLLTYV